MKCSKCGYETVFREVIDGDTPCIACGFSMDGVKFYGEATSFRSETNAESSS